MVRVFTGEDFDVYVVVKNPHQRGPRRTDVGRLESRDRPAARLDEPGRDQHPQAAQGSDALDPLGVTADVTSSSTGPTPRSGSIVDVEAAVGLPIGCAIPSSREIPLSMNVGTPVVITTRRRRRPSSSLLTQLLSAGRRTQAEAGVAAMSSLTASSRLRRPPTRRRGRLPHWHRSAEPHQRRPRRLQGQVARRALRASRPAALRDAERGALHASVATEIAAIMAAERRPSPTSASASSRRSPATSWASARSSRSSPTRPSPRSWSTAPTRSTSNATA